MPLALLGLLVGVFFSPALFFGQMPLYRDFVNTFLPYKLYAARALRAGSLPLWAPEPSFGAPFLANYQSGVLYPLSAIVYLLPGPAGVGLYLAVHFWLGAAGMMALLARRGLGAQARALGAIVYVFGGTYVSISGWSHLAVAAWIPFAIVAAERWVEAPSPRRFLALVLLLLLQGLGGAPESFAQSGILVLAAAVVARGRMRRARRLLGIGAAGLLSLGIAAAQLLPTAEYFAQTTRAGGLPREIVLRESLGPLTGLTLLVPHRIDGGVIQPTPEGNVPLYWSVYLGLAPLVLVLLGATCRRGLLWTLAGVSALLMASGENAPLFPFLLDVWPRLFGAFRYPQKFLLTAHLAAAVLAAVGLSRAELWAGRGRLSPRLLSAGVCLVTAVDLLEVHFPAMLYGDWQRLLRSAPPAELGWPGPQARIFHYDRTSRSPGLECWYPTFGPRTDMAEAMRRLWASLGSNVSLVYGIGFTNGRDSFEVRDHYELERSLRELPPERALRVLRSLGVRFLIGPDPLDDPSLELLRRGGWWGPWIYRVRDPVPRAYLARRVVRSQDARRAFERMGEPDFRPGTDAVSDDLEAGDRSGGTVRWLVDRPAEVALEVQAEGPALLVVSDSIDPGWRARVDGEERPILRVNGLARGIELAPGTHRVRMRYEPASFRIGLAVSILSLFLSLVVARAVP